jgi:hypothetical protein
MKLRIKGNSLRLRVTPSEVSRLLETGRIEETIRFARDEDARLTYAVELSVDQQQVSMRHRTGEVAVLLPTAEATRWAGGEPIGIYADLDLGGGSKLTVAVEKDFACLHGDDRDNKDTFLNPRHGAVC